MNFKRSLLYLIFSFVLTAGCTLSFTAKNPKDFYYDVSSLIEQDKLEEADKLLARRSDTNPKELKTISDFRRFIHCLKKETDTTKRQKWAKTIRLQYKNYQTFAEMNTELDKALVKLESVSRDLERLQKANPAWFPPDYKQINLYIGKCKSKQNLSQEEVKKCIHKLVRALEGKAEFNSVGLRKNAVSTLGKLAPESQIAIFAIGKGLFDVESQVRFSTIDTLMKFKHHSAPFQNRFMELLKDSDSFVRMISARAIGTTGPSAVRLIPALSTYLNDKHAIVRQNIASTLGRMGKPAVPVLLQKTNSKRMKEKLAAIGALSYTKDKRAHQKLISLSIDANSGIETRTASLRSLSSHKKLSKEGLASIAKAKNYLIKETKESLQHKDAKQRILGADAAYYLGKAAATYSNLILKIAISKDYNERSAGVSALGKVHSVIGVPLLIDYLTHEDTSTRYSAQSGLANLAPISVPGMKNALKQDDWEKTKAILNIVTVAKNKTAGLKPELLALKKKHSEDLFKTSYINIALKSLK